MTQPEWTDADTAALEVRLAAARTRLTPEIRQPSEMTTTTWRKYQRNGNRLFCSQCRRPYTLDFIYRVGHLYLCEWCWMEIAQEYQIAFQYVLPTKESTSRVSEEW